MAYFSSNADGSDNLANRFGQYLEFYHIPSGKSVKFKAYVTTFEDSYSTNFEPTEAFGRMDPIQTYRNTTRNISLAWDVPAGSRLEAYNNMKRSSLLLSMLYPSYDEGGGGATTLSSPPMFKIKFLNLIQGEGQGAKASAKDGGLLGTISGFTYAPDLEAGFFQNSIDETSAAAQPFDDSLFTALRERLRRSESIIEKDSKMLPKTVKFSCQITVLHQRKLGWKSDGEARKGFDSFPYSIDHKEISGEGTPDSFATSPNEEVPTNSNDAAAPRKVYRAADAKRREAEAAANEITKFFNTA